MNQSQIYQRVQQEIATQLGQAMIGMIDAQVRNQALSQRVSELEQGASKGPAEAQSTDAQVE
ncbi:hypothetical protein [Pararhodobacter zhoushanensis]|uniref:hypothetical protein n=1 Tax=Pararhodobacter zhoushanensis TaxID=2479545 RepID=UPI000F8D98D2|nr:hypothetical protein [Pararhodobacter zhoushanensis]